MKTIPMMTAAVATTGVLLVAGPASAAGPYTVTAGSQTTGTVSVDGTSVGTLSFQADTSEATCQSGTASGSINLGSSADGVGIGSLDSSTWNGCTGSLGELTLTQTSAWRLNATGTPTNGVTPVTVDNIAIHGESGTCSFDATGSADGTVDEATQTLSITPPTAGAKITISNVSFGCFGVVANGDEGEMTASYEVTNSSDGPLSITSP